MADRARGERGRIVDDAAGGDEQARRRCSALLQGPALDTAILDELLDGLVARHRPGGADGWALDLLVEACYHQPFLRAEIRRILFNDQDAEEALQDTILAVVGALGSFRGDAKFRTWARRIAHHNAVGLLRRRRDQPAADGDVADDAGEVGRFSSVLAARTDIEEALATLGPEFGDVVRLRDLEHLTYEQIADRLDLKVNTVRSRLARGRARLATTLTSAP